MANMHELSLEDRMFILSKTYNAIATYFAHWSNVPGLDLDEVYKSYLPRVISTEDRFDFGLLMMEVIATLRNGHSWYSDNWMHSHDLYKPLGFGLSYVRGEWLVTSSQVPGLLPGDGLLQVNGQDMECFFRDKRRYICASSDWNARMKFPFARYLFPLDLQLRLAGNRQVSINRNELATTQANFEVVGKWMNEHTGYIKISTFATQEYEDKALDYVNEFREAKALIMDMRGHNGGMTPMRLLKALSDRPLRFWTQSTNMTLGRFKADAHTMKVFNHLFSGADKGLQEMMETFQAPSFLWPGACIQDVEAKFKGKLIILIDGHCRSAGEDFVMPLKDNGRATLVGSATHGSTGQPYPYDFGNGISIFIGTTRAYFPDGSAFEGIGVRPDVEVFPSKDDMRKGRDTVLEKALELIEQL